MSSPASSLITQMAYGATQLPRIAWYLGHGLVLRRLSEAARPRAGQRARRRPHTDAPVPERDYIYADMIRLFMQDLANVEAGIYPVPADHDGSLLTLIHRSLLFFEDLPKVHRRRERRAYNEVLSQRTGGEATSLLSPEFPLPVGWLDDGRLRRKIRHPSRGAP
jgi:hypothetical protein